MNRKPAHRKHARCPTCGKPTAETAPEQHDERFCGAWTSSRGCWALVADDGRRLSMDPGQGEDER